MDVLAILLSPTTWAVTILTAVYFLYRYATSTFDYFSKQGIPGPKPIPIFGSMWGAWKRVLAEYDMDMVKKYGKVFGYFDGKYPNLWITDTDMIKAMYIKNFDHFVDRRPIDFNSKVARKWLTVLQGQEWKDIRSSITPAFTTGKIKRMSTLINYCVDKLCDQISTVAEFEGKIDSKLTFSALTMDVVARCAFGMKIDSLGDKDDPFIRNAQFVFNPPASKSAMILFPFIYPKLFCKIGEKLFINKQLTFFFDLLQNLLRERSNSEQKFHDFIEVANEAISDCTKVVDGKTFPMWSREEIEEILNAQSSIFMLAGFDTTATALTTTCFELAKNPDMQEKLYDDIIAKLDNNGEVNHDMVQDFPYLEQIIHEVLRFYPPSKRIERVYTKDYSYDNGRIKLRKGTLVTIPAYALHHMEEYYPDPEKFDPDRWSPENKAKNNPYAFMAFGIGPRNCVGMRFAIEELKIAICSLVKQFRFFPVKETPEKFKFDVGFTTILQPIHVVLGVENRQSN